MTTIGTRPYPDDGAAVIGRAATMPPVTAAADRTLHCEPAIGGARPDTAQLANPAPRPAPAAEQVRAGVVLSRFTRRHLPIYPVWSPTMPANTRSPHSRPHGAPACHLARTASLRVTTAGRQPQQCLTLRTGKSRS
jgi:hypothetical protein